MNKNQIIPALLVTFFIISCGPGPANDGYGQPAYVGPGIGLGTIIAVVISWSRNKSILWAIIHGILGWLYVIYALIVKPKS
ncbi:MAG: hypothetical protein ABIR19_09920 [Ginsengibacter sp.]